MSSPTLFASETLWAPLPLFLLQILLILVLVRALGKVIGEILAGVVLGPSVLGYIPGFSERMFPDESKLFLTLFSSVGLCFFMFFLGLEVDPVFMLQSWRSTLPIALVSMSIPFGVGMGAAAWIWEVESDETQPEDKMAFSLFVGSVFAFSAFPVLARILDSSRLITSPVGIQALGLAAVEDVTAWCVLALIISYAATPSPGSSGGGDSGGGSDEGSAPTSGWDSVLIFATLVLFIAFLLGIVRPLLGRWYKHQVSRRADLHTAVIPPLFFGFLLCSWFTEALGIHAFFGAFVFGAVIPKEGELIPILAPRIELLIVHVFLPVYFACSGMKTQLGTLSSGQSWMYTIIVIALASVSKITAVTLSAKVVLSIRKERIQVLLDGRDSSAATGEGDNGSAGEEEDGEWSGEEGEEQQHGSAAVVPPARSRMPQPQHQVAGSINNSLPDGAPQQSIDYIDYNSDASVDDDMMRQHNAQQQKAAAVRRVTVAQQQQQQPQQPQQASLTSKSDSNSPNRRSSQTNSPVHGPVRSLVIPSVLTLGGDNATAFSSDASASPPQIQSHTNRTHAIPGAPEHSTISESDRDEFGLDIRTGMPLVVSRDDALIQEFVMTSWKHALTLGVLLNSRGLVALIVLNIGLDKKIIGPEVFSMLLFMSIICTCLTSPIIFALYGARWQKALIVMAARDREDAARIEEEETQRVLLEKVSSIIQGAGGLGAALAGAGATTGGAEDSPVPQVAPSPAELEARYHAHVAQVVQRRKLSHEARNLTDHVSVDASHFGPAPTTSSGDSLVQPLLQVRAPQSPLVIVSGESPLSSPGSGGGGLDGSFVAVGPGGAVPSTINNLPLQGIGFPPSEINRGWKQQWQLCSSKLPLAHAPRRRRRSRQRRRFG